MVKGTGSGTVGFSLIHHSPSFIKPFNFNIVIFSLSLSFLEKGVIIITVTEYGGKRLDGSMKSPVYGNVELGVLINKSLINVSSYYPKVSSA